MRASWLLLAFVFFVQSASGANHYIRAGAAGLANGSNWTDAWRTLASVTFTRGDTYYIAGGTYTESRTITNSDNGSWIYIKKATVGAHGSDIGWSDSYAAGQAIIVGQLLLYTGHIDVDGVTGSGNFGHGIKIDGSGLSSAYPNSPLFITSGSNNINLSHIEIGGIGQGGSFAQDGVYNNNIVDVSYHYYSYLYIHDIFRNGITWTHTNNSYIDHCYFQRIMSTIPTIHGQSIQLTIPPMHDNEIRYNTFEDTGGQAQVSFLGVDSSTNLYTNFYIYGNVVFSNDRSSWTNNYFTGDLGPGGPRTQNVRVYNNTFYNAYGVSSTFWNPNASGNESRNNLYVNSYFWFAHSHVTSTNNFYYNNAGGNIPSGEMGQVNGTRTPFANAPAEFRLASNAEAINKGVALGSQFAIDITGVIRSGTVWDIGAYASASGSSIGAPGNLRIVP